MRYGSPQVWPPASFWDKSHMLGSSLGTWREPGAIGTHLAAPQGCPNPQVLLLVAPGLQSRPQVGVDTAYPLPPTRDQDILMLGAKHGHILDFTVPTKVQEGLHNPNRVPGRAHLSLSSGVCADEGLSGAYSGDRAPGAVVTICVRAAFPAETRLPRHPLPCHTQQPLA